MGSPLSESERRPGLWLWLAMSIGALIAFLPTMGSYFQEDDFALLDKVSHGDPFGEWTHHGEPFFRPLISLFDYLQFNLFGPNPIPYRIFNDLFHAGCATMVGLLAWEWGRDSANRNRAAWTAAILFLVAPSHAEAINWIASRTDLVASFFGLLGLWLFTRYIREEKLGFLWGGGAALFVGMMAKESVILIPIAIAVYLKLSTVKRKGLAYGLLAGLVAVYVLVHLATVGTSAGGSLHRYTGASLVVLTLIQWARLAMPGLPLGDSGLNNLQALKAPGALLILFVGFTLIVVAIRRGKDCFGKPEQAACLALFAVTWLPAIGLSVHLLNSVGERFLYLPSAVLFIWVGWALTTFTPRKYELRLAIGTLVFAGLLTMQNRFWRQAANMSQKAAESFAREVVPHSDGHVFLATVPGKVQGGYVLLYQYPAVADLLIHKTVQVTPGGLVETYFPAHRIGETHVDGAVAFDSLDHYGFFDEATGSGPDDLVEVQTVNGAKKPNRVLLRGSVPLSEVWYWNGEKFVKA